MNIVGLLLAAGSATRFGSDKLLHRLPHGVPIAVQAARHLHTVVPSIYAVVKPIGFNHDISLALLPAMAAREVAVSAIGTVYAIDSTDEEAGARSLADRLQGQWPLPTALAFLAWFVFAPQCISTIAVTRRETNSWRWPLFMVSYLFVAAYIAAGVTYWTAVALGL